MKANAKTSISKEKKRQYYRINIYIPAVLYEQMLFCYPEINWSKVAQKAFRQILTEKLTGKTN